MRRFIAFAASFCVAYAATTYASYRYKTFKTQQYQINETSFATEAGAGRPSCD